MKKSDKLSSQNQFSQFLIYTTPNEQVKVEVFLNNETAWLTQKKMAELFGVGVPAINKHLSNIFNDKELDENSVISILETTASDGKKYQAKFYNLDAIISVGYRVNSVQATRFRVWATERLREYIIKGFTMDDERLKNPSNIFGVNYFEEQLERIRNIRSSERRFYQKITDIYTQCSSDYAFNSEITKSFFATVQNKLHWAITGQTAAEIISSRVDSNKENIGLTTWKNSPKGEIRRTDVIVAKNYLDESELDRLNRIVTMYLDYAESQAKKGVVMYMKNWIDKLDAFLRFNEHEILLDSGKVSHNIAVALAEEEYEKYRIKQDKLYVSDFDKDVAKLLDNNKEGALNKKK